MISQSALLETLVRHVDAGIHVVDCEGVTILYNDQAAANDALEPGEVIGHHVLKVFPSLDHATSTLLKVLQDGQPILGQEQTFTNYKGFRITTVNSTWPIYEQGQLLGAVEISKDVTRVRELSEQVVDLQAELMRKRKGQTAPRTESRYTLADLIGRHPRLVAVKEQALRAARGSSPVLIYGETGTGKELLVHAIHAASGRSGGPFVAQNCAALPEGLLEGILFGTVRGSFTGAEDRPGLFELADGGTLYLDEINSMDLRLQAKLLRVLQDGLIRRVGDTRERAVNVRVIASANQDPQAAMQQERLRQDLYYRLNVVYLELPALRERPEDIPLLTQYFVLKHSGAAASRVRRTSDPVKRFFAAYSWPGNVRELEHAIEAGLHMATGEELRLSDLPVHLQRAAAALKPDVGVGNSRLALGMGSLVVDGDRPLRGSLRAAERQTVERVLADCGGNLSRAARALGVPRQTLQYRLKILGLTRNQ